MTDKPTRIMSESAAAKFVRRLFAGVPPTEFVTPEEIYRIFDRDDEPQHKNQKWLANYLVGLKRNGLIETAYGLVDTARGPRRRLASIGLTPKGKSVLPPSISLVHSLKNAQGSAGTQGSARIESSVGYLSGVKNTGITLKAVGTAVREWEEQHPSLEVSFDIRLKRDEGEEPDAHR